MDLIILIATIVVNLVLGLMVLTRSPRQAYAQSFAVACFLIVGWILTNYLTNFSFGSLETANFVNKLAYATACGAMVSILVFTYLFPMKRSVSWREKTLIAISAIAVMALSFTNSVAGVVTMNDHGDLIFSAGSLLWLYIAAFIAMLIVLARNLVTSMRNGSREIRRQTYYILFAFVVAILLGIFLSLIAPLVLDIWDMTRFAPLATVVAVGTISYTIVRHGLFDIRLAVVRGVVYGLTLLTLAAVYYVLAYAVSVLFIGSLSIVDFGLTNIVLALLLAFVFQPIRHFFDLVTNRVFYRGSYDEDRFFARYSQVVLSTTDLRYLLESAAAEIGDTLGAAQVLFYIFDADHRAITAGTPHHSRLGVSEIDMLSTYSRHNRGERVVARDSLTGDSSIIRMLRHHEIALAVPLIKNKELIGFLFVGEQRSGRYTARDTKTILTILSETMIAIENALSVEEVRELNATLQQRIDDATKELRASNAKLQKLDETKDEFVSMASHQLRTPLTSVKGYISMVLEGDVGKITADQRKLLSEAFMSSERMVRLISDFLNVSRLQTGKFVIDKKVVDLAKVVAEEVDSLRSTASAHSLKLQYRQPKVFPLLGLDEDKIRQVVMNFIDNAIYYSREHTTISIKLRVEDGDAVCEVRDTGIGVPKDEQASLFTKFFRATNARKQRPDGTGVGLFLARKIIVAHGGSIIFHSAEGRGSTFGFRLPIAKLAADKLDNLDDHHDK